MIYQPSILLTARSNLLVPAERKKNFTLDERFYHSYLIDNSFLLLFCLLTGFNVWWAYLPLEQMECYNINPLNVDRVHTIKVLMIDTHRVTQDFIITDEVRDAVSRHLDDIHHINETIQRLKADTIRLLHPTYDPLNIPKDCVRDIILSPEPEVEQHRWGKTLAVLMGAIIISLVLNEVVVPGSPKLL